MERNICFLLLQVFYVSFSFAQFDKGSFLDTGLLLLDIKTVNNEEPACEFVFPPEGSMGVSIAYVTKVPGRLMLIKRSDNTTDTIFDSGEYVKDVSGMKIKIRGNSSAYDYRDISKYPFKISLQKKADMLCRDADKYKDKDWVLINTANKFGNDVGRFISQQMCMPYTPAFEYVNLFINDKYRGTYLLSENIKRNDDCRINVQKEGGFIIEHDPYWWNEDVSFGDSFTPGFRYTLKYPDVDDVTHEQLTYISNAVEDMENRIYNGNYEGVIDLESFVRWLLAEDILGSWDGGGVNLYLSKEDDSPDSKFTLPCLWDYDSSFEVGLDKWSNLRDRFLFNVLLDSDNRAFAKQYKLLWESYGNSYCANALKYIHEFRTSDKFRSVSMSFKMEEQWYALQGKKYPAGYFTEWLDWAEEWFDKRPRWIDEQIKYIDTAINENDAEQDNIRYIYDLCGRRLASCNKNGVYIRNGKIIIK